MVFIHLKYKAEKAISQISKLQTSNKSVSIEATKHRQLLYSVASCSCGIYVSHAFGIMKSCKHLLALCTAHIWLI